MTYTRGDKAQFVLKKDKKTAFSVSLFPSMVQKGSIFTEINRYDFNEEKISFGVIQEHENRLEFVAYPKKLLGNPNTQEKDKIVASFKNLSGTDLLVFLNGERIIIDLDNLRKLNRVLCKIRNYYGEFGRKKPKKQRKKSEVSQY